MPNEIKNTRSDRGAILVCAFAVALVSILQHISYDVSAGTTLSGFLSRSAVMHLFGCGFALMLTALAMLVTGRLAVSCAISSAFCAVFSVLNHYVCIYFGQPFSLTLIAEAGTALDVTGGYRFSVDRTVAAIAGIFLLDLGLCFLIKKRGEAVSLLRGKKFLRVCGLCCAAVMMFGSVLTIRKKTRDGYIASTDMWLSHSGYVAWALTDSYFGFLSPLRLPPGYSADEVRKLAAAGGKQGVHFGRFPDIILVLNESLYDMDRHVPVKTDVPYFEHWYAAKNAFRGHALSPYPCGGTGDSEFELLTSHPSFVAARRAPMSWMEMDGVHSVASYLGMIGYQVWAVHPCAPMNYRRAFAWPALGFKHIKFYDDFAEHEFYGNRRETDASNYREMIKWYEGAGEGPRFFFMLTYQNHGGYEQNDSSLDTVHAVNDFGANTPLVNEFLTSVRMSDEALGDLLTYFESVDRPTLVCVVGDHAPHFCREMSGPSSTGLSSREMPLMIWANPAFGSLNVESASTISMTGVVPLLLRTAGLPLSPFYAYLDDTAREIPVRDRDGTYIRADGAKGMFEAGDENYARLLPLYSAAYADLTGDCADVRAQIFAPPAGAR